eukprot:12405304-Karenia_brevis.AAC.1
MEHFMTITGNLTSTIQLAISSIPFFPHAASSFLEAAKSSSERHSHLSLIGWMAAAAISTKFQMEIRREWHFAAVPQTIFSML